MMWSDDGSAHEPILMPHTKEWLSTFGIRVERHTPGDIRGSLELLCGHLSVLGVLTDAALLPW